MCSHDSQREGKGELPHSAARTLFRKPRFAVNARLNPFGAAAILAIHTVFVGCRRKYGTILLPFAIAPATVAIIRAGCILVTLGRFNIRRIHYAVARAGICVIGMRFVLGHERARLEMLRRKAREKARGRMPTVF